MKDFENRIYFISEETIIDYLNNSKNPELNNVVEGFEKYFYGIILSNQYTLEAYSLVFITNEIELKGIILESGRFLKDRDLLTLKYCKIIEQEFSNLNQLITFNTFQSKITQLFETFGILCIPEKILNLKSASIVLPHHKKEIDHIIRIDIWEIYKSYFSRDEYSPNQYGLEKVYLMYDRRLDRVKIGKTKNLLNKRLKEVSEATKRANNPLIEYLTAWIAPPCLEITLHEKYKSKRVRGEWFDLRAADLEEINLFTKNYPMISI